MGNFGSRYPAETSLTPLYRNCWLVVAAWLGHHQHSRTTRNLKFALNCLLMKWFIAATRRANSRRAIKRFISILLAGLPYDLSLYWHQYPYNLGLTFCKMRALISEAWVLRPAINRSPKPSPNWIVCRSTYVSVLTIVAFSMERFLAICHPLHLYTMSGLQRAVRIIGALWVISFLSAVPFAVFTKVHYLEHPKSE